MVVSVQVSQKESETTIEPTRPKKRRKAQNKAIEPAPVLELSYSAGDAAVPTKGMGLLRRQLAYAMTAMTSCGNILVCSFRNET